MSRFISETIAGMAPYVPGEQPQGKTYIKLNTNELPYPPSPKVREAITDQVLQDLRLYPPLELDTLRRAVADKYGLSPAQVYGGNGSDEVLAFIYMAFFGRGRRLYGPDLSYGFYPVYGKLFELDYREIPLRKDLSIALEDYRDVDGGIILANPNAPTGLTVPVEEIEALVAAEPDRLVIVDEAYGDFWGQSCVPLISRYDNLLMVQTLSKSRSLAGMRIGLAMGNEELINDINRVKFSFHPYNVDRLSILAAARAFEDEVYFRETVDKVIRTREWVKQALRDRGFTVTDTQTNFLFAAHGEIPGKDIYEGLKERGILVRHFDLPQVRAYNRISIGTDTEMDAFLKAVDEILEG